MSKNLPSYLIIHHTGGTDLDPLADTSHHTFEVVDGWHKSLGWGKIGYHYFIEKDGKVTQGRQDNEEGAHTKGYNLKSLGICLAGNFDATKPTTAQTEALRTLLKAKVKQYNVLPARIVPHRVFAAKSCYGKHLSDTWAQDLIKEVTPPKPPVPVVSNDQIRDAIRKKMAEVDVLLGQIK